MRLTIGRLKKLIQKAEERGEVTDRTAVAITCPFEGIVDATTTEVVQPKVKSYATRELKGPPLNVRFVIKSL